MDIYHYTVFGVACTEVEIDCLTGDHTVDLLFHLRGATTAEKLRGTKVWVPTPGWVGLGKV